MEQTSSLTTASTLNTSGENPGVATSADIQLQNHSQLHVNFSLQGNNFHISAHGATDKLFAHTIAVEDINILTLRAMILLKIKPLFLDFMPSENFEVHVGQELLEEQYSGFKPYLIQLVSTLHNTNKFLQKLEAEELNYQSNQNTLIYNLEGHFYLENIYDEIKADNKAFYETFSTGWNAIKRQFDTPPQVMPPEDLLNFIKANSIGRIVSINQYYLETLFENHNIYLLALLQKLGVEYNTVDWDIYAINKMLGLNKLCFNSAQFKRYDVFPSIQKNWNEAFGVDNTAYHPGQALREEIRILDPLNENYQILCAANSRLANFKEPLQLERVLAAFDLCTEENLFHDFQFWFHAISLFLIRDVQASQLEKLKLRAQLIKIHFDGISLLKYEALAGIKTDREILLYGDEEWQYISPNYYQGDYLPKEEVTERIRSGDYLHLQLNNVFSYPEAHPIISEALSLQRPFLGFPAVAKTPELQGFEALEYRNVAELNHKLDNINSALDNVQFQYSLQTHSNTMKKCWTEFCENLTQGYVEERDSYKSVCEQHLDQFKLSADKYIKNKRDRLWDYLKFLRGVPNYNLNQSLFRHKPYVEVIVRYRDKQ